MRNGIADYTVLVVDDEPTIVRMIGRILSELPCRVLTCYDAESAMQVVDAEQPHLVITDVRLPGMDGIELTDAIKRSPAPPPVLLLSAYGEPRAHAGDGFIAKPFDNDDLISAVKRCLGLHARSVFYAEAGDWPFTVWFGDPSS
jgi:CheY-like chemotaxis protein